MRRVLLLLALAPACGDDGGSFVDAAGDDTPIDAEAQTDGDVSGALTVTTFTRDGVAGARVGGVPVVVIFPDGSNVVTNTDANGDLTVDVVPGVSVTAIYPLAAGVNYVTTFVDAAPGDHLQFGELRPEPSEQLADMNVTWPAQTDVSTYTVYNSCGTVGAGGAETLTPVIAYSDCASPNMDVLVVGYDATGNPIKWAAVDDVPYAAGGTITIDAFQPASTLTVSATGMTGTDSVEIVAAPIVGPNYGPDVRTYDVPDTSGTVTITGPWSGSADGVWLRGLIYGNPIEMVQEYYERLPADVTEATLAGPPLPWVSFATFDAATRTVSWTQTGATPYDTTVVDVFWYPTTPAFGLLGATAYEWRVIAPPGATSLTLPALPAEFAGYYPDQDDILFPFLYILETSAAASYDELRNLPEWQTICFDCAELDAESYPRVWRSMSRQLKAAPWLRRARRR